MESREQLAMKCIRKLEANGHKLFGCPCGRIHVDPMGLVNPKGWEEKELVRMYFSAALGAIALFAVLVWALT